MVQHIKGRAVGSAVPGINLGILKDLPVVLPPLLIQHKVAAILSAYDDFIENNNRRIKLLEEMAQRIYREWFVDFRYPGHEGVPLVDSEFGPIPQRWEVTRVGDHARLIRGRSYRGVDVADDGGLPFVTLKCVSRDGGFRVDGLKRYVGEFKSVHRVFAGDIVIAVTDMTQERRIVARAARVPPLGAEFGVISMDLVKVVPVDLPADYLYAMLRFSSFPESVKAHANGANVLHLNPDRITDFRLPFPMPELARHYSRLVSPMSTLSDSLVVANACLRTARDILLPRLISGDIDVDGLNVEVPEAA
jgi:type I restriction enzyme S subunit